MTNLLDTDIDDPYWNYIPRLPLPTECHYRIDAAVNVNDNYFLIANSFIWKFASQRIMFDGYPKRISSVFPNWDYSTNAAFEGDTKIQITICI